jgi:hypothetical protein
MPWGPIPKAFYPLDKANPHILCGPSPYCWKASWNEEGATNEGKSAMRKIIVLSFVTLDGVMQAPGGPQEDTDGGFNYGG